MGEVIRGRFGAERAEEPEPREEQIPADGKREIQLACLHVIDFLNSIPNLEISQEAVEQAKGFYRQMKTPDLLIAARFAPKKEMSENPGRYMALAEELRERSQK